jgi:RimJ/RimL family protein N-acetyltransferase
VSPANERRFITRDGVELVARPIRANDRDALRAHFEALSAETRYRRFLAAIKHLSERELTRLTDLDHREQEALIALTPGGELVGVARFFRLVGDSTRAEVAVTIADAWQGRGVGTALLHLLAERADELGVRCFVATCLAHNRPMLDLFRELGTPVSETPAGDGIVEVEVELPTGEGRLHYSAVLRRFTDAVAHLAHPRS